MAGDFVEVYRGGGGAFRAEMLRSLLSGSGIESIIDGGVLSAAYPTTVGMSGEFRILVRAEEGERAADLLRTFEEEGTELEELEEPEWPEGDEGE